MINNTHLLPDWTQTSEGVFVTKDPASTDVVAIGVPEIESLKILAQQSSRKRARICAHAHSSDLLHQMILVIQKESYIHPHRHHRKVESFHLIEGQMDVVVFSDEGEILKVIPLRAYPNEGGSIFYRLSRDLYHTLIIHTPFVVFHEITQGPFDGQAADLAPWAPRESEPGKAQAFIENLKEECRREQS